MKHQKESNRMFDNLVKALCEELSDFGEALSIDGKAIESYTRPRRTETEKPYGGRRDIDGDFGVKKHKGKSKDGSVWEKSRVGSGMDYILLWMLNTSYL
jgi:hypothetical protein